MIHHHHRITSAIALTLALTASAAPVAWGDPQPRAQAGSAIANHTPASNAVCGDVCSGHGYGSVGVATSAPTSSASCGDVCSGHGYGSVGVTASAVNVRPHPAPSGGGFDWGDAGIGAGGAFALTIIGLGGVLAATNRRRRQPQHQEISANS